MTFGVPAEEYEIHPAIEKAMDRIFILHADHEQNASTSTVRLAGSSGANPFACMAAGIACLWGPAHGGANEAALNMLQEIGSPDKIPHYIERAKDKNDPFRLMGFGHRVYKNYDPRATVMQQTLREVFEALNVNDPGVRNRAAARRAGAERRLLQGKEALPERRLLLGHHPQCDRLPDHHVHRAVRAGPYRRLGRAVERDDLGSRPRSSVARASSTLARPSAITCRSTSAKPCPIKQITGFGRSQGPFFVGAS